MKGILRLLLRWLFGTQLINFERLVFDGPAIILPNHLSFLDAVFLYVFLPGSPWFVVNTNIAARIGFALRWIDHVTIDPLNPYAMKQIVHLVREGRPVVLFPEGRITTTGGLMKVYAGVGFVGLKTGATLYPVIFSGLQYSKLSRIRRKVRSTWFPRVTVYAGTPARLAAAGAGSFRQQKKELSDQILALLQENLFIAKQLIHQEANLFDRLLQAGGIHGMTKPMAEDLSGTITYRKAIIGSYILAGRLKKTLAAEPRVGVLLPNSIGHVVTLFALFYAGITPAVLNFSAGAQNNLDCGATAGLKTILTSRVFVEKAGFENYIDHLAGGFRIIYLEDLRRQVDVVAKIAGALKYLRREKAVPGEARLILFTSGSENKPKGVVLRHANVTANINQAASIIDYTPADKMLNALPMFHSFGLTAGTLLPILEGIEVFLYPSPLHYRVIPEVAYDRNITLLLGTPTFLMGYAKAAHPYDFYSLRYVLAGGEKLKPEIRDVWHDKFGLRIFEGYGTTETAPVLCINTPLFNKAGTVGRMLPGIEWRVEPVEGIAAGGNLLVKGPNVMEGYLRPGTGFVPVGDWYSCGDVVEIDPAGYVTIKSRLRRFAKISGEMIGLDSVEQAAEQVFGGDKHAAVSVPDHKKGEKIILYTQQKKAAKQALREYLGKNRQTMLAMPAKIIVVDKLPLLGSGKVDYVSLQALAVQEGENDEL